MFAEFARRLLMLFRRRQFDADFEEEMRLHRELREQEQIKRGFRRGSAVRGAAADLATTWFCERKAAICGDGIWLENLFQDLRYGSRMLAKNPGFTLLITGLLAVGIGSITVIFSLFDAVFLRPLPVRHPEELVRMAQQYLPKIRIPKPFPICVLRSVARPCHNSCGRVRRDGHVLPLCHE